MSGEPTKIYNLTYSGVGACKWEYEVNVLPREQFDCQGALNAIGKDGLELVALDFDTMMGVFKRPRPAETVAYQGKPCDNLASEDIREVIEIDECCTTIAAGCGCSCTT